MKWIKKNLIFSPDDQNGWIKSHAQIPIGDKISDDVLRIYFGTRDKDNRTLTTFIEVETLNPSKILYIHDKQILPLGKLGTFDDRGVMPSSVVNYGNKKYLYYTGWNIGGTVPYRNSIGLAISKNDGLTFQKLWEGPIIDRNRFDPYFTLTPFTLIDLNVWKMWYGSCTGWINVKNKLEPLYNIRYAESADGIQWKKSNVVCIDYKFEYEAICRPHVIKEDNLFKMWYSYRGSIDYRTNKENSYRIGYAESLDGIHWTRKDYETGIDLSETGWDSEMIAYCFIYEHNGTKFMLYNGNGFGKTGFGYAILDSKK